MKNVLITLTLIFSLTSIACQDKIGDSCSYDVDCSPDYDRTCDNGQPNGYCLIITCEPNQCPSEAACVEFITPSPDFDTAEDTEENSTQTLYEQLAPNRSRTYCLKRCKKDSSCRSGYHCAIGDELEVEMNGTIIDYKNNDHGICVPGKRSDMTTDTESDTDTLEV